VVEDVDTKGDLPRDARLPENDNPVQAHGAVLNREARRIQHDACTVAAGVNYVMSKLLKPSVCGSWGQLRTVHALETERVKFGNVQSVAVVLVAVVLEVCNQAAAPWFLQ